MKVLVAFSGGKDSQASLIWAIKKYGLDNVEAVFCDTGWENPVTYDHIMDVCKNLGVKVVGLKSKKYNGMIDLAKKKKRFPSVRARFCTEELKIKPFIDYILTHNEHLLIVQGIRGGESEARAKLKAECYYFKNYFYTPMKFNKYGKLIKGKKFTYRKKEVYEFCKNFANDVIRPVFDFTGQQVMDYILDNGQKPNPLYYEGFKRVGCFPCIMCSHQEIKNIMDRYPEKIVEISEHESRINSAFFKTDGIPEYARTGFDTKSGKKYSTAIDVKKYLEGKNATLDMFGQDTHSCMSHYSICE